MKIDKKKYVVHPITKHTASVMISKYHYSKTFPKVAVYCFGLFNKDKDFFERDCLGVCWFLPPTKVVAQSVFDDWKKVLTLSRMVIVPNAPKNSASFLLSKCLKMINKDKWKCIVTYADEFQNHTGVIYKASNFEYIGLTKPSPIWINQRGEINGKKRGNKNLSTNDMINLGYKKISNSSKHKFRYILK